MASQSLLLKDKMFDKHVCDSSHWIDNWLHHFTASRWKASVRCGNNVSEILCSKHNPTAEMA